MTDLASRGPLGLKTAKPAKRPRKALPRQSAKRRAYRASAAGMEGLAHMARVKALPCVVCGAPPPSEAHHCRSDGMARDDFKTIALCKPCHTGPNGYHRAKRSWEAAHGKDYGFIPVVRAMLDDETEIDF